ncbi:MAG: hypothetical protein KDD33_13585, partial [Bdellovibrionales bacterium]|nr:hypothetical protein [Bdellovibrionales bacterium]
MDKSGLRVKFKKRLAELSAQQIGRQSEAISKKLCQYLSEQQGYWALYSPLADEPNLLPLLERCPNIQWIFPKVESHTEIRFYPVKSREQMIRSSWGLDEPSGEEQSVPFPQIQGFIIPAIAYDEMGFRLGR